MDVGTTFSGCSKKMKTIFLSRYQETSKRGAEVFVRELTSHLQNSMQLEVLSGKDADNLTKVLSLNPDVVIPINGRLQSLKVSLGRLIKPYKMVISGHSGMGRDDWWNILVRPDVFIALTETMRKWASLRSLGVRIEKISNGVDLDKFNPKGSKLDLKLARPVILAVGALTKNKHHERAIRAVAKLDQGSLLIVGEGEEEQSLRELGQSLLGDRFSIKSFDYSNMAELYRAADLFTLLSWDRESFGIVYLEAMASGLPVVAPLDGARKEIIGDAGILIDAENEQIIAEAMKLALQRNWENKPRQQAERFSWNIIAKRYKELLLQIGEK